MKTAVQKPPARSLEGFASPAEVASRVRDLDILQSVGNRVAAQEIATQFQGKVVPVNSVSTKPLETIDYEVPRLSLLQKDKDGNKAGEFVNNVTGEKITETVIPLFYFKNFAKFTKDLTMEWSASEREDPRVKEALDTFDWKSGQRPSVTEFLNFAVIVGEDVSIPLVLSFKSATLKLGRKYNTLFAMSCGYGLINGCKQFVNKKRFALSSVQVTSGKFTYWQPKITIPTNKINGEVGERLQKDLQELSAKFVQLISHVPVVGTKADLENTEF